MKVQRDQVIAAALELLQTEGLEGLSMRKLAVALEIQAPSLYWHFASKQALIDGMADTLAADVARVIPPKQSWEKTVRQVAGELRQSLLRYRDGARVYAGTYVVTDNVLRVGEALIGAFGQAGASPRIAAWTAFSVSYFVLGFVIEEQTLPADGGLGADGLREAFLALAAQKYPKAWEAHEAIFDQDFDKRFALGLDLLVDGFKARVSKPRA